jgi:hypothetical protein
VEVVQTQIYPDLRKQNGEGSKRMILASLARGSSLRELPPFFAGHDLPRCIQNTTSCSLVLSFPPVAVSGGKLKNNGMTYRLKQ